MRHSHHALRVDRQLFRSQAKIDQRMFGKGRVGFDIAATQAQVGQLAMRDRLFHPGALARGRRMQPSFELCLRLLRQVQKMNPGLSIGIRPCHLSASFDLQASVGQPEAKIQQCSRSLRLRGKHVHAGLAKIQKNALDFTVIGQTEFHRSLHWNSVSAPPFPLQQGGHSSQSGLGFFFEDGLIEDEVSAQAQDAAHRRHPGDQSHRNRRVCRIQTVRFFQHFHRLLGLGEVDDQSVESLLLQAVDRGGDVTNALRYDPARRQNPAQGLRCGIVCGNQ